MAESAGLVSVVGAGPGVGGALARRFAEAGHPLLLIARNEAGLEQLAVDLRAGGAKVDTAVADASVPGAVGKVLEAVSDPLAALIYNAAGAGGPLLSASPEDLRDATEVNLHSLVAAVRASLPALQRSGGVVLITGGGLALHPASAYGVLSVGKAMTRTAALLLSQELAPLGLRVVTVTIAGLVAPGTPFDPTHIAEVFLKASRVEHPEAEIVFTGG